MLSKSVSIRPTIKTTANIAPVRSFSSSLIKINKFVVSKNIKISTSIINKSISTFNKISTASISTIPKSTLKSCVKSLSTLSNKNNVSVSFLRKNFIAFRKQQNRQYSEGASKEFTPTPSVCFYTIIFHFG